MNETCKYQLPCGYCDKFDKRCNLDEMNFCDHEWRSTYFEYSDGVKFMEHVCKRCGETIREYAK